METNTDLQRLEELKDKFWIKASIWAVARPGEQLFAAEAELEKILTEAFDLGQMLEAQKHNPRNV